VEIRRELPDLRFDAIEAGMRFGPLELMLTEHLVKAFAFAVDDFAPLQLQDGLARAAVLVPELQRLLNTRFEPNTMVGLHQKEEVFFHSAARIGETAVLEGRCVATYVRRGKGYFVMEAEARSAADGRLLVRHRSVEIAELGLALPSTEVSSFEKERRVTCAPPAEVDPVTHVSASVIEGTPVVPLRKSVHQDQIAVFSNAGRFWRNIHTDLGQAREAGHDRTLAQGLMQTMYIAQLGAELFGDRWTTSGWIWTTYVKPLLEGETVTVHAVVSKRLPGRVGTWLELETWVETSDGKKTTLGCLGAEIA
jgi:hypothetical protein